MDSSNEQPEHQQQRIFLWIVPRTCSTVLSKCMTFVDDVQVWMESYLACSLNETLFSPDFGNNNVGRKFVADTLKKFEGTEEMKALRKEMKTVIDKSPGVKFQHEMSWPWVKEQLEKTEPEKKIVFIKDQSGVIFNRLEFLPEVPSRHTFLIRHPMEVFSSWRVMMRDRFMLSNVECDNYKLSDISAFLPPEKFFQTHHQLWKHFCEVSEEEPIIIDAYDLVTRPEVILPKYFEKLGIPFKESYLQWDVSEDFHHKWKGSDQCVLLEPATNVYSRAVKSVKFDRPQRERGTPLEPEWELTPEMLGYIDAALPYYKEMYELRLCQYQPLSIHSTK